MQPPNPHDALVRSVFGDPANAVGELQHLLPPPISSLIAWSTLSLCPGTFVDQALRERHTDLLFKAQAGERPVLIYLLFEHQSTDDPLMAFRLLRYVTRIWEQHLRDDPSARKLPAVVPMVLHHSERGWTSATRLDDLIDLDAETLPLFAAYLPRFQFLLDDISHEPDPALHGRAMSALGRLALFCLRHAREPRVLVRELARWLDLVREVRQAPGGRAALERIWRYIFLATNPPEPKALVENIVAVVGKESEEDVMTVADWLRSEGRREGHLEALRKTLLKMLGARFGAPPADVIERVQSADEAQLDTWLDRILAASSLDEVLAAP